MMIKMSPGASRLVLVSPALVFPSASPIWLDPTFLSENCNVLTFLFTSGAWFGPIFLLNLRFVDSTSLGGHLWPCQWCNFPCQNVHTLMVAVVDGQWLVMIEKKPCWKWLTSINHDMCLYQPLWPVSHFNWLLSLSYRLKNLLLYITYNIIDCLYYIFYLWHYLLSYVITCVVHVSGSSFFALYYLVALCVQSFIGMYFLGILLRFTNSYPTDIKHIIVDIIILIIVGIIR